MGRLNVNVNVNANAGLQGFASGPVRFNSLEYAKALKPKRFPSESTSADEEKSYQASQDAVNQIKFRHYWDAEVRASVYLNEFLTENSGWLPQLKAAIKAEHDELQDKKGAQLREMLEIADEREERFAEIIDQHEAEGPIKYWLGMLMIDSGSAPATYQLIRVARRVGEVVVMCLKEEYGEARPSQVCPAIMPMIDPPVTPSFPAGHALQSHLISTCLVAAQRLRDQTDMLVDLAKRIAENRVVAGLHYPLDNKAGETAAGECFRLLLRGEKFKTLLDAARAESYLEWNPTQRPEPVVASAAWRP
jgi:acid phosphatase (class A)